MNELTPLVWHDLQWCLRRTPKHLLEALKKTGNTVFVAGGFIRSCVAHEPVNDIDCFAQSKDAAHAFALILADGKAERVIETGNAFTIRGGRGPTIQVVHRWTFQTPEDCIASFDFTIARAAFWWVSEPNPHPEQAQGYWKSASDPRFYPDLAGKRLIYCSPDRNEDAGGSMLRVLKFYQRGYRIPIDSLGAVIARMVMGMDPKSLMRLGVSDEFSEPRVALVATGLLREVDPQVDPSHVAHLPAEDVASLTREQKYGYQQPEASDDDIPQSQ